MALGASSTCPFRALSPAFLGITGGLLSRFKESHLGFMGPYRWLEGLLFDYVTKLMRLFGWCLCDCVHAV